LLGCLLFLFARVFATLYAFYILFSSYKQQGNTALADLGIPVLDTPALTFSDVRILSSFVVVVRSVCLLVTHDDAISFVSLSFHRV
jgi:hypothetical protein